MDELSKPNLAALDADRISGYRWYWDAYSGNQWLDRPSRREQPVVVNYLSVFANKIAAYLMSPPPSFSLGDAGAAQMWQQIYRHNNLAALDYAAALSASVLGDAAFRLGWDVDAHTVSVTAVDMGNFWVRTKPDDIRVVEWAAQRYWVEAGQPGNLPDTQQWGVQQATQTVGPRSEIIEEWTATEYRQWQDGRLVQQLTNPYGLIPYIVVANRRRPNAYWGESDLLPLLPLQTELNRAITTFAAVMKFGAAPVGVIEGADHTDQLQVGPGELWTLPPGAKAYLLEMMTAGGAQVFDTYLNELHRMLHDIAEVPRVSFGDVPGGVHSGVALQVQLQPMMQSTARRRLVWGDALARRVRMALAIAARMGGAAYDEAMAVEVIWPSLLPSDRDALVQHEVALVAANIHTLAEAKRNLGDAAVE